jgi:uncharacterized membrane protein
MKKMKKKTMMMIDLLIDLMMMIDLMIDLMLLLVLMQLIQLIRFQLLLVVVFSTFLQFQQYYQSPPVQRLPLFLLCRHLSSIFNEKFLMF